MAMNFQQLVQEKEVLQDNSPELWQRIALRFKEPGDFSRQMKTHLSNITEEEITQVIFVL